VRLLLDQTGDYVAALDSAAHGPPGRGKDEEGVPEPSSRGVRQQRRDLHERDDEDEVEGELEPSAWNCLV
jgi:hypothetical protein